jgi:CRP-like cAMP-binding protein
MPAIVAIDSAPSLRKAAVPDGRGLLATRNKLLKRLPASEAGLLMVISELVTVKSKEIFFKRGGSLDDVYFPEDCVISLVTELEDGHAVEAMTVGNDGFTPLALFNGVDSMNCRGIGQVTGQAWRIRRSDFVAVLPTCPGLRRALHLYSQLVFETVAQSAACNRLHEIERRCARWLLMSHDRVGRDSFDLTQEFLSQMLGVRRAGVTVAIGILERQGLLSHTRGNITIVDREGLEGRSCECYATVKRREALILS